VLFPVQQQLVDGGKQRRSFTFIDDGIEAIAKMIENKNGCASKRIFNVGNPKMDFSVRELAEMLLDLVAKYPGYKDIKKRIKLEDVSSAEYYGAAYQDVTHRVPSIKEAEKHLGWKPKTDLKTALKLTLDYHLLHKDYELNKMQTR